MPSAVAMRVLAILCSLASPDRPCRRGVTVRGLWMSGGFVVDGPVDKGGGVGDNGGCLVDVVWMAEESSVRWRWGLVPQVGRQ